MKQHSSYRSIDSFKNFISGFKRNFRYSGKDSDGMPIYDPDKILPIIPVIGTEKIHGTNAAIGFDLGTNKMWVQSRKHVISPDNDNMGFATWAYEKHDMFTKMFYEILDTEEMADREDIQDVLIYGEWAGGSVQKKSACTGHDKIFIVFDVKIRFRELEIVNGVERNKEEYLNYIGLEHLFNRRDKGVYSILHTGRWTHGLDFNNPQLFLDWVEAEVLKLEEESKFGKGALGLKGNVGEGIVFKFRYEGDNFVFKVKGGKHAERATKIPKMNLTPEQMNSRRGFAFQLTPQWRLAQMFDEVFQGEPASMRKTGAFIKAVMQDIIKEESNVIADAGYTMKDLNGEICNYIKHYLTERIREEMNA